MTSTDSLLFIALVICFIAGNEGFAELECTENVGESGQKALVECVVKTALSDVKIRVVRWSREEVKEPLLVFHEGETTLLPRYSFAESSWDNKNMNISLLITNTGVQDEGAYTCEVVTNVGFYKSITVLRVTAKYNKPTLIPIPKTISRSADGALECYSDGGYPEGELRWFDEHNTEWTNSATAEAIKTESGVFQLLSKLTLMRGSIFSNYTCAVFNASGGKEHEVLFQIPDVPVIQGQGQGKQNDSASKIVAPLVVIGSLIVGLLVFLIYRKLTKRHLPNAPPDSSYNEVVDKEMENGKEKYNDSMA